MRGNNYKNMLDIIFLKSTWFFKEISLEKGDLLFDEWELNDNIYIILTWELLIEKYTTNKKNETKILWKLIKNDIFWEWALNDNKPKEVKIVSSSKTYLIYISAKKEFDRFSKKHPEESMKLLKYIIYLSNKRLTESNYFITANYKISKEILNLKSIDNKSIFWLIDKIEDIVVVDYILYLEKNIVMENYLTMKYDSRIKGKMLDKVIEITNNKLDLLELKLSEISYFISELNFWENHLWYLIFFKKDALFSDNSKKILTSISIWVSWVIKQKQLLEEQRDKDFMRA